MSQGCWKHHWQGVWKYAPSSTPVSVKSYCPKPFLGEWMKQRKGEHQQRNNHECESDNYGRPWVYFTTGFETPFICRWDFDTPGCACVCTESLLSCLTLVTIWTVSCQVLLPMWFSRQEYWSGVPRPPPGDLPDSGIEPASHTSCTGRRVLYHNHHLGSPLILLHETKNEAFSRE